MQIRLAAHVPGAYFAFEASHLREVQQFLEFLRFKRQERAREPAIALGGLLDGYRFTEEDIAQARRDMWGHVDGSVG